MKVLTLGEAKALLDCYKSERFVSVQGKVVESSVNRIKISPAILFLGGDEIQEDHHELWIENLEYEVGSTIMVNDVIVKEYVIEVTESHLEESSTLVDLSLWFCASNSRLNITEIPDTVESRNLSEVKPEDFEKSLKLPLGLTPLKNWEEGCNRDRIEEIFNAMTRYSEVEKPIPLEWISELYGRMKSDRR
jgi:hypothetical protein